MDDALAVRGIDRAGDLAANAQQLVEPERPAAQALLERRAFEMAVSASTASGPTDLDSLARSRSPR